MALNPQYCVTASYTFTIPALSENTASCVLPGSPILSDGYAGMYAH